MRLNDYLRDPERAEKAFRTYAESLSPDHVVELEYNRRLNDIVLRDTVRRELKISPQEWNALGETEKRMNILSFFAPPHCLW